MESPPDPVHTEHLLCSWGPLEDGAPELSPRLCPQQARNTRLWEMGKTETLSCPGAQVKGGLSLAEVGDRRKQRWLLGCIRASPSWLCPTHRGVEGKLGAAVLTTRNHTSHSQPARGLTTCPEKEHFPGQELTWGSSPRASLGRASHDGSSGPRGKGRIKKDVKRLKGWKKRETEGGKEGQRAGLAAQGPSSL